MNKKIVFLTGTRADFGKMKPLMKVCEEHKDITLYVFVSGMHLLAKYGNTYKEIQRENYTNVHLQKTAPDSLHMDINLSRLINDFSEFVREIHPDMIVVHGDRIDALAGAIVAMLNNILLGHIEGGEVTGTVDESIRHAISKMSNLHFVANNESLIRLKQLGEDDNSIFVIGSPDIDVMLSDDLAPLNIIKEKWGIHYDEFAIAIYHPVVSELDNLNDDINEFLSALVLSEKNYIIIYPNNDSGSEIILEAYKKIEKNEHFKFFPSLPFEEFLVLLKNASFVIGNSSCGVREACVYGIPAIDIGTRQKNRYSPELLGNIQNISANESEILKAISDVDDFRVASSYFGEGNSANKFAEILADNNVWAINTQKVFFDSVETQKAIKLYHNEICF